MMMSQDLQLLRLQDDLEQAIKEIKHIRGINENLINDYSSLNTTLNQISIENNALRLERDELRDVINLADNGIAEINSHWKQKFFMWRETESQLLKELSENKNKLHDLTSNYEAKFTNATLECNKAKKELMDSKKHVVQLGKDLERKDEEINEISAKLMNESKNNIQHMFVARENSLLTEKVKILEAKVHSFYDDSLLRQSREQNQTTSTRYEAERDFDLPVTTQCQRNVANLEILEIKRELHQKKLDIENLQEELSRVSCHSEAQTSKIKYLKNQADVSNNSVAEATLNAQKDRDKLKKASVTIADLNGKLETCKKINDDLKTEMGLKFSLLGEKDDQIQHYKTCCAELEIKASQTINEVNNYKHTLSLAENEKLVIKHDIESWIEKHDVIKVKHEQLSNENKSMADNVSACNTRIALLSKKYKDAEISNTNADRFMGQYQQKIIDLEVELNDKNICLNDLSQENSFLKNEVSALLEEIDKNNKIIDEKTNRISILQNDLSSQSLKQSEESEELSNIKRELSDKITELSECKLEMNEKVNKLEQLTPKNMHQSKKHASIALQNSFLLVDSGTITEPDVWSAESEINKLRQTIQKLTKDCTMKEKKLTHAQSELKKQATVIVHNQCQIDQLSVKCASLKALKYSSGYIKPGANLQNQIKILNSRILELNIAVEMRDNELDKLKRSESELKKREQTFWELSEMVNTLQIELDNKHTNILKEVNFYKQRLMEYEIRTPSVNKSINTSIPSDTCDEMEINSAKSNDELQVDLQDLENVMNHLKSNYQDDLNAIHASFIEKMSQLDRNESEENNLQWIDLMNK